MRTVFSISLTLLVGLVAASSATSLAQRGAGTDATARIVAAAQAVVATLDDAGKAKVRFPFDGAQKTRWSNLPSGIFQRQGLRIGDLSAAQKSSVMNLLTVALSRDGYRKVTEIMKGDEVLAINLTLAGSQASMTPSLPAAQPATYTVESREIRPLGRENDKAFALINALDATQRSQAILSSRVADLVLGPGQDGRTIQPEGIRATALTPAQQTMLVELAREWTGIVTDAFAEPRMAEIRADLPQTWFAWSGQTTNGSAAYFRIQGPTLVIEYAPQGGSVDHIHTIYRDPTNDYGAKFAAK
jgi:Protein of unknown function (DUF3500)